MKLNTSLVLAVVAIVPVVNAFAPVTSSSKAAFMKTDSKLARFMSTDNNAAKESVPFFASQEQQQVQEDEAPPAKKTIDSSSMTLDEEVDALAQEAIRKTKVMSNLRNENGVDYAPWMGISAEQEANIRQVMKEKAAARRKREEQERSVKGNLYLDSVAQELSGTGLVAKVLDEESVELEWRTSKEVSTKGYIVKRRAAKTNDFETIGSYENYGPLVSQGSDGGVYRFLDDKCAPGSWVYRVTECDVAGQESDICQCLVEVQTKSEQLTVVLAAVIFATILGGAVFLGITADPLQGYQ